LRGAEGAQGDEQVAGCALWGARERERERERERRGRGEGDETEKIERDERKGREGRKRIEKRGSTKEATKKDAKLPVLPLLVTFGRQQRHQVEAEGAPRGVGKRARGGLYTWTQQRAAE